MNQESYERFWAIHLRVSRGQPVSAEDQAFYEAERKTLEGQELLGDGGEVAREARTRLLALQEENALFQERRRQLDAEIAALEAALNQQTRQLLGVKE